MELKITKERENPLFGRKEITGTFTSEKTPSREEILNILAKHLSVSPENLKIKTIKGKYGSKDFDIEANVYSSREEKERLELKKKKDSELEKKAAEKLKQDVSEKPEEISAEKNPEEKNATNTDKENVDDDKVEIKNSEIKTETQEGEVNGSKAETNNS